MSLTGIGEIAIPESGVVEVVLKGGERSFQSSRLHNFIALLNKIEWQKLY